MVDKSSTAVWLENLRVYRFLYSSITQFVATQRRPGLPLCESPRQDLGDWPKWLRKIFSVKTVDVCGCLLQITIQSKLFEHFPSNNDIYFITVVTMIMSYSLIFESVSWVVSWCWLWRVVADTRGTWQTWRMMQILSWCWRSSPGWARPSWELTIWKSEHQLGHISHLFLCDNLFCLKPLHGLNFDSVV